MLTIDKLLQQRIRSGICIYKNESLSLSGGKYVYTKLYRRSIPDDAVNNASLLDCRALEARVG